MKAKPKRPQNGFVPCFDCDMNSRDQCKTCQDGLIPVPITNVAWDEYLEKMKAECDGCHNKFPSWQLDDVMIPFSGIFFYCPTCNSAINSEWVEDQERVDKAEEDEIIKFLETFL